MAFMAFGSRRKRYGSAPKTHAVLSVVGEVWIGFCLFADHEALADRRRASSARTRSVCENSLRLKRLRLGMMYMVSRPMMVLDLINSEQEQLRRAAFPRNAVC